MPDRAAFGHRSRQARALMTVGSLGSSPKPNTLTGARQRSHQLANGVEHDSELRVVAPFQLFEPLRQVRVLGEQLP